MEIRPLEATIKGTHWRMHTERNIYELDEEGHTLARHEQSEEFDRYETMLLSFAEMVRGEKQNPYTYEYEKLLHHTVLLACGVDPDAEA